MAAPYDLDLIQGETYERTFRWLVDGAAQPLAEFTIRAQLRTKESRDAPLILDLAPLIALEPSDVPEQLDRIRLRIPATVTAELNPRNFRKAAWDLFLVETADPTEAFALLEGAASLDGSTTDT